MSWFEIGVKFYLGQLAAGLVVMACIVAVGGIYVVLKHYVFDKKE